MFLFQKNSVLFWKIVIGNLTINIQNFKTQKNRSSQKKRGRGWWSDLRSRAKCERTTFYPLRVYNCFFWHFDFLEIWVPCRKPEHFCLAVITLFWITFSFYCFPSKNNVLKIGMVGWASDFFLSVFFFSPKRRSLLGCGITRGACRWVQVQLVFCQNFGALSGWKN